MVRKKKQPNKKANNNRFKNIFYIFLTIIAIGAISYFSFLWFANSDVLELNRGEEIVFLCFSQAGIPATKINKNADKKGYLVFKTTVTLPEIKKFEKSLKKYIKNKKIKNYTNGKIIQIETTTDTIKIMLSYKKGTKAESKITKSNQYEVIKDKNIKPNKTLLLNKNKFPQPLIAIIIDDVGIGHMDAFKNALSIPYPITFAILPFRQYTKECAELAKGRGFELILHMPMEPYGYPKNDPGPGAIFEKDNKKLIEEKLISAFDAIKYAKGLNNHMGSKITSLKYSTRVILNYLKENGYFFIDSRTSVDTIALSEANNMKLKALKRNVFLDNSRKPEEIEHQLSKAVIEAKTTGFAIAIGHNYPETITELKKQMPILDKEINFMFVKDLVNEISK